MVRPIRVRSRGDLEKLARELEKQFTVVFTDDDSFLAMKDGRIVKRFRVLSKSRNIESAMPGRVDRLPSSGHVLLMYDDMDDGRRLEYRFLTDGLSNGERCAYVTHMDVGEIERDMTKKGIPVGELKAKNQLHVHKIEDPFLCKEGWPTGVGRIIERIMSDRPDRIISWRWIRDLASNEQNLANRRVEQAVDAAIRGDTGDSNYRGIKNFSGVFVCAYPAQDMPPKKDWGWLTNHLATHNATILAEGGNQVLLKNETGANIF